MSASVGQAGAPELRFPVDWETLTPLPYRDPPKITSQMTDFVGREILTGGCSRPTKVNGHRELRVDVAVLLSADAEIRATVPHAVHCPTVEQFTAGLVTTFARNNLKADPGAAAGWYRATVVYVWDN
ncbi:hypothetical protein J7S20_06185 [Sphingomonadaceae bacterium LXI357]|uniref:DUF3168 domain-containing protein n=1 Tax=Stakelama marina TaxID=2826939 RepID=A0A8T4IBP6_9SPHN|nr:hypothetical protein [Stakelama marina]